VILTFLAYQSASVFKGSPQPLEGPVNKHPKHDSDVPDESVASKNRRARAAAYPPACQDVSDGWPPTVDKMQPLSLAIWQISLHARGGIMIPRALPFTGSCSAPATSVRRCTRHSPSQLAAPCGGSAEPPSRTTRFRFEKKTAAKAHDHRPPQCFANRGIRAY
jgi:hypothetical protein